MMLKERKHFCREKDGYDLEMTLSNGANPSIQLLILNLNRCEKYILTITEEELQKLGELFFSTVESVSGLYDMMVEDFQNIKITEDGCIQMEIQVMVKKQITRKMYQIKTQKIKLDSNQQFVYQLNQFKIVMTQQLSKRDIQIAEIMQDNKELKRQYESIRDDRNLYHDGFIAERLKASQTLVGMRCEIDEIRKMITEMRDQRDEDQVAISQEFQSLQKKQVPSIQPLKPQLFIAYFEKFQKDTVVIMNQFVSFMGKTKAIIKSIEQQNQISKLQKLFMNLKNPHRNSFEIQEGDGQIFITKIDNDAKWQTYICAFPLSPFRKHTIVASTAGTKNSRIVLGIGTKNMWGVNKAHRISRQVMGYSFADGKTYLRSVVENSSKPLKQGVSVTMEVDTKDWTISWQIEYQQANSYSIPENFKTQQLYVIIEMCHVDDCVMIS